MSIVRTMYIYNLDPKERRHEHACSLLVAHTCSLTPSLSVSTLTRPLKLESRPGSGSPGLPHVTIPRRTFIVRSVSAHERVRPLRAGSSACSSGANSRCPLAVASSNRPSNAGWSRTVAGEFEVRAVSVRVLSGGCSGKERSRAPFRVESETEKELPVWKGEVLRREILEWMRLRGRF